MYISNSQENIIINKAVGLLNALTIFIQQCRFKDQIETNAFLSFFKFLAKQLLWKPNSPANCKQINIELCCIFPKRLWRDHSPRQNQPRKPCTSKTGTTNPTPGSQHTRMMPTCVHMLFTIIINCPSWRRWPVVWHNFSSLKDATVNRLNQHLGADQDPQPNNYHNCSIG